jgi:hypothetical protein
LSRGDVHVKWFAGRWRSILLAIAGTIVVILAGIGLAHEVGVRSWIGIVIVALVGGVVAGSVGVISQNGSDSGRTPKTR